MALAGLAVMAPSASAVKPTITATSGNVNCQITGKVKLHPGLKNNWVQADHQTDPNAAVRANPEHDDRTERAHQHDRQGQERQLYRIGK
ncbi:MAG: hypothetical protein ACXVL8_09130 [Acidimicrobiia bacterium]